MLEQGIRLILKRRSGLQMRLSFKASCAQFERFKFNPFQGWISVRVFTPSFTCGLLGAIQIQSLRDCFASLNVVINFHLLWPRIPVITAPLGLDDVFLAPFSLISQIQSLRD